MANKNDTKCPLVSAVVTTYNRPELCKRALRSVKKQTYEPLEIIVVEDGSETRIEEWIKTELPSAKYIRHEQNRGLAAARNTGLSEASGEYVAYLDDDDKWKPRRIEQGVAAFNSASDKYREDIAVAYCGVERQDPAGTIISIGQPENKGDLAAAIRDHGASTLPSTYLFDKDALESVGGFDEALPSSIDHDIWMSLAVEGFRALAIKNPLVVSYVTPSKEAMTNDTIPRIYGVKLYIKKWKPTYKEWFGPEAGEKYAEEYFAEVIMKLARKNLESRSYFDVGQALCAVFSVCNDGRIVIKKFFWGLAAPQVLRLFPNSVSGAIKNTYKSVFE